MRRVLINISVSAASLLLCLGVAELVLRLFTVAGFQFVAPSFFGDDNWFEFHPDLRYTLRRDHTSTVSYRNDECGQTSIEIVTNGAGIRDRFTQSGHSRPLAVFVGDSFTEGYHVDADRTYPALVRASLGTRVDVINYGIHNYDALDYYRAALHVKEHFDPDFIFAGLFVGNDVMKYNRTAYRPVDRAGRLRSFLRSSLYLYSWTYYGLKRILGPEAALPENPAQEGPGEEVRLFYDRFSDVDCPESELREYIRAYRTARRDKRSRTLYGDPWKMFFRAKSTVMVLRDMKKALGDTELHVLVIPERAQVSTREWEWLAANYPDLYKYRTLILEKIARELTDGGISFTDLHPFLSAESYLRFDGHLSELGHAELAAVVTDLLRTKRASLRTHTHTPTLNRGSLP